MKSFFCLSLSIFLGINLSAQEKISTYEMSLSEKAPFLISAVQPDDKGEFTYYINLWSLDASVKQGGLILKSSEYEEFKEMMLQCLAKLDEWDSVANSNNIVELRKDIPITIAPDAKGFFQYGSGWKFDHSISLTPEFYKKSGYAGVLIHTGKVVASDNQYMDCKDLVIALTEKELRSFLEATSPDLVISHFKDKAKQDDLFK